MRPAIQVTDLGKRFGDVQALDGVDLAVDQGEFFGPIEQDAEGYGTLRLSSYSDWEVFGGNCLCALRGLIIRRVMDDCQRL